MACDTVLPRLKHFLVVLLLCLNPAGVLQLSEFRGSILKHLLLKIPAHSSLFFGHLLQDIRLVRLSSLCRGKLLFIVDLSLARDFGVNECLLDCLLPLVIVLFGKFVHHDLFAVCIHTLQ